LKKRFWIKKVAHCTRVLCSAGDFAPRARGLHAGPQVKIAQIAPLAEGVPPRLYGAAERIVSYLTEELMRLGHDVTLFASGDSQAPARLAPMFERVRRQAHEFDVLHFHTEALHFPIFRSLARKCVTTVHRRPDAPESAGLYRESGEMALVSISNSQRSPLPGAHWAGTVYHGLPAEVCPLNPAPPRGAGRYLAFLGRVAPEEGLLRAIDIARRARVRLRIAAKIDPGPDERYWRSAIAPLLADPLIQYVGEMDEARKPAFLGNATALLFPVDGPEPFGLAMIEAMSCGTPVIGWRNGAAPEIVDDGATGKVVASIEEAVQALPMVERLDRARVRARFEQRFSAARMTRDYLAVYRTLGGARRERPSAPRQRSEPRVA
jgi:glycosyltransferase involved in cell wall biosynthesis